AASPAEGATTGASPLPTPEVVDLKCEGDAPTGNEVVVTSLWGGSELEAFQAVLCAYQQETGNTVRYEGVRDKYAEVLQTRITGGNPPDIAVIPGIGSLRRFAKAGNLKKLSDLGIDTSGLEGTYPAGFLQAGQVDGEQYALPAKYNSKSTIWYRPDVFEELGVEPPDDWEGFKALVDEIREAGDIKPLGLGAGGSPSSEWTLTDWFESIYIRQAGVEAYDKLFSAEGNWTDQSVKDALTELTTVLSEDNVVGGIDGALGTDFVSGIGQVFKPDAQAAMYYEGGFVGGIALVDVNDQLEIGTTIDFFEFPSFGEGNPVTFGGDVVGALTDKPGVKELIEFIATPEAGQVWIETGAVISPVSGVTGYPNELTTRESEQLAGADDVRYDGSDLLPASQANLGFLVQDALRGKDVGPLLDTFQQQVALGWENE
ncbi:MAG: extracellular solute-binding protein, partial [Chloroflexi bacterium]|nr:extracellular solute-binding protein [Chloroflexota bacterium]